MLSKANLHLGRSDFLQWASDNKGGLTGYLNYRTEKEGQPGWASTGGIGSVAAGTGRSSEWSHLADLTGDVSDPALHVSMLINSVGQGRLHRSRRQVCCTTQTQIKTH